MGTQVLLVFNASNKLFKNKIKKTIKKGSENAAFFYQIKYLFLLPRLDKSQGINKSTIGSTIVIKANVHFFLSRIIAI